MIFCQLQSCGREPPWNTHEREYQQSNGFEVGQKGLLMCHTRSHCCAVEEAGQESSMPARAAKPCSKCTKQAQVRYSLCSMKSGQKPPLRHASAGYHSTSRATVQGVSV